MSKKKEINALEILTLYMSYVLEHNTKPSSVYTFAKENKFEEAIFYNYFGSFEAIEKEIFNTFFKNTISILEKSKDYQTFDARNKLLSFYYTFFENLTANRSYVIATLDSKKLDLKKLDVLSSLKTSFTNYIDSLEIETIDLKQKNIAQIQQKSIKESAWIQLLITLKFWMNDTSASFEKTDIFIEKSVNTSFDVIDSTPLKSIIDLGKFLYKEKMNIN
ncbi:TetR family transcriptional regulator C-terminal domain-containing protein [Lutibacter sp. TH_r2]|uniref:TetR family transcriptional regulator C-terminal domain-containing protein n=1 Tax=Lutibacter sp. TH_r2 TaxID=3082083 RepID=UPI002952CB5E|nr:TetR family transcriptional regulator C-terminal domain-containing protein [Lutibacter sp. TH_r2]MDV7187296.1 TetR family transcriptional regulator C-terminal domain-containing protein [Lutibacter sp. TH_r2]